MRRGVAYGLGLILAAVLGSGCETGVEFVAEDPPAAFALNGFLDTAADTQFVRVERLPMRLDEADRRLRGTVTSTGPSGATKTWRDSAFALTGGPLVTLAFLPERAEPGLHIVTIRADDGTEARAAVTVPPRPTFQRAPILLVTQPIIVGSDTTGFFASVADLAVTLGDLTAAPDRTEVRYYVRLLEAGTVTPRTVTLDYTGAVAQRTDGRYGVTLRLRRDFLSIRARPGTAPTSVIALDSIRLATEQRGPAYDRSRPSTLENAVGFLGGVGRYTFPIAVGADTLRLVGFQID